MKHNYTLEELKQAIKDSYSLSEVLKRLGLVAAGGNYKTIKVLINKHDIDKSHFTGQGWRKNKQFPKGEKGRKLEDILLENVSYNSHTLKQRLILEGFKQRKCENCLNAEWLGKQIPLELEHCNGNNMDNRIENLKLLCPNCHAQTKFYRSKNRASAKNKYRKEKFSSIGNYRDYSIEIEPVCECGKKKSRDSKQCRQCESLNRTSKRVSMSQLAQDFKELKSFIRVGKKYGVSDNTIRKWLVVYKTTKEELLKLFP